jgi:hypothetical protein
VIKRFTLIAVILLIISGCRLNAEYVVKIGQDSVDITEFRFYFLLSQRAYEAEGGADIWYTSINGVPAEEVAKERALESLTVVKVSNGQANRLGVKLDEKDRESAEKMAEDYRILFKADLDEIGMTGEQLLKIMEESSLRRKVFEETTKNVVVSDHDFEEYVNAYFEQEPGNGHNEDVRLTAPQIEEIRAELYYRLTEEFKERVFEEEFARWRENIVIEKNPEIWDSIKRL